jgi:hypothetical protein
MEVPAIEELKKFLHSLDGILLITSFLLTLFIYILVLRISKLGLIIYTIDSSSAFWSESPEDIEFIGNKHSY